MRKNIEVEELWREGGEVLMGRELREVRKKVKERTEIDQGFKEENKRKSY
jgi:hypothetical protein